MINPDDPFNLGAVVADMEREGTGVLRSSQKAGPQGLPFIPTGDPVVDEMLEKAYRESLQNGQ